MSLSVATTRGWKQRSGLMWRMREFFRWNWANRGGPSSDLANSAWMLAEKFVRLATGIVVGAYVARFLGPNGFGVLAYTQSIIVILLSIAAFGLNAIIVRSLVSSAESAGAILGAAVTVNLLGCVIAGVGYVGVLAFANFTDLEAKVFTVSGLAVFFSLHSPVEAALQARLQYRLAAAAIILASLAAAALRIVLVHLDAPLVAFAYAFLAEQGLTILAFLAGFLSTEARRLRFRTSWMGTRRMLSEAFPVLLSSTIVLLYMRIDQIMIRQLMGIEAVGVYTAAVRISEAWYFVPTMLTLSLFPSILRARQKSETAFERRMRELFDIVVVVSWIAVLAAVFLGETAVLVLFGPEFGGAAAILKIHVLGGLFVAVGVASSRWYLSSGWERRLLYRTIFGLFVNIVLNALLIPALGLAGAAWATVVGYAAGYWLFDLLRPETRSLFRSKTQSMLLFPSCLSALKARHG